MDEDVGGIDACLADLADLDLDPVDSNCGSGGGGSSESRRTVCKDCLRPARVCWCPYVASPRIAIRSEIYILQHPNEAKRNIRTALMAQRGIAHDMCNVRIGTKFPGKNRQLETLLQNPNVYLLYPGPRAVTPDTLRYKPENVFIILDGSWNEARKLYARSPMLQALPQVCLPARANGSKSAYVVRTQPASFCLSTVETVAEIIALAEGRPEVPELLLRPLHAMCSFQIHHGAVEHDSKEIKHMKDENREFVKKNNFKTKKKSIKPACSDK